MKTINFFTISILFFILCFNQSHANEKVKTLDEAKMKPANDTLKSNKRKNTKTTFAVTPPVLKAIGDQLYCPLNSINIVTSFTISHDPAELGTKAAYIQISSGYSSGLDKIEIQNPTAHPSIVQGWYPNEGKLVLSSPAGGDVLYSD